MKRLREWTKIGMILNLIVVGLVVIGIIYGLLFFDEIEAFVKSLMETATSQSPDNPGGGYLVIGALAGAGITMIVYFGLIIFGIVLLVYGVLSAISAYLGYRWLTKEEKGLLGASFGKGYIIARVVMNCITELSILWILIEYFNGYLLALAIYQGFVTYTCVCCLSELQFME